MGIQTDGVYVDVRIDYPNGSVNEGIREIASQLPRNWSRLGQLEHHTGALKRSWYQQPAPSISKFVESRRSILFPR